MGSEIVRTEQSIGEVMRRNTDVAGAVRDFAVSEQGSVTIGKKRYPRVETWQAIANAYGLTGSSRDVEPTKTGFRAIGEVRRLSDGVVVATAEGFVGMDEPTWFGGVDAKGKQCPKRPEFAIRAMAQTRAISRACRSALAFVVPLIDAGMATTPAEEMEAIEGEVVHAPPPRAPSPRPPAPRDEAKVPFGKLKGQPVSKLSDKDLEWYAGKALDAINDPAKERWHAGERQWLGAVREEQVRRGLGQSGEF
jgi:hypothetical protein